MDEAYLLAAARYVELNPVKAKLCRVPWAYKWSSAAAHIAGKDDLLVKVAPILKRVADWRGFLAAGGAEEYEQLYERHESTGRPLGPKRFLLMLEKALSRVLQPQKVGRKRKERRK
jgi:putative transposase